MCRATPWSLQGGHEQRVRTGELMLNADPVAVDDQAIVAEPTHGSDQDPMLRTQDPRREGRLVIDVVHCDRRLRDDRSVVDILRDEMGRAAVYLDPVGERL